MKLLPRRHRRAPAPANAHAVRYVDKSYITIWQHKCGNLGIGEPSHPPVTCLDCGEGVGLFKSKTTKAPEWCVAPAGRARTFITSLDPMSVGCRLLA